MPGLLHKFVMGRLGGCCDPFDRRLFKKNTKAAAPDPRIGEAAMEQARLGKEYLAFEKDRYAASEERQDKYDAVAEEVTRADLASRSKNDQRAGEQWERYRSIFAPVEDAYAAEAADMGSAADQARAAGAAAGDVQAAGDLAIAANNRNMASLGVDPNSGKFQSGNRTAALTVAANKAGATTSARTSAVDRGMAYKASVSNMGRNMSADTNAGYGLGLQAGSAALQAGAAGQGLEAARASGISGGYSAAMQGQGALANTYGQQYAATAGAAAGAAQAKAGQKSATIGAVATIAVMI